MATITGLTAAAMDAIANGMIIGATINGSGDLIFTQQDTSTINAGNVIGPTGPQGPAGTNGTDGASYSLDYLATHNPTAADWSNNSHKITGVTAGTASGHAATYEQVVKKAGDTMAGYLAPKVVTLTFGSSIAVDASLGNQFRVTLTSSAGTLANPTNAVDGQAITVNVKQDSTGSRTLAYDSAYSFSTSLPAPTLSTAANAKDRLVFIYDANSSTWDFAGFVGGYSA